MMQFAMEGWRLAFKKVGGSFPRALRGQGGVQFGV